MRSLALSLAAGLALNHGALAADLPLESITLYRSGVGYFEHSGSVNGHETVTLRFEADRVNDILKSMVAIDFGGGRIAGAAYEPHQPLTQRLEDFRINPLHASSVVGLMAQIRGAEVSLRTAGGEVRGVVLGTEKRPTAIGSSKTGEVVEDWAITLVTDSGVSSVAQADIRSFQILDESLAEELRRALSVVAEHRDDRWTGLDVTFDGRDERRVMVAYTHEAPVWKTSYRLVLPDGTNTKPTLQGWAIVENDTDEDWEGVNLSLASGRPVSFVMDLQTPLLLDRPIVAVPAIASLPPEVFQGATIYNDMLKSNLARRSEASRQGFSPSAEAADSVGASRERRAAELSFEEQMANLHPTATGGDVGEQFIYTIDAPVSIQRGQSSMLPILSDAINGRRLSIYKYTGATSRAMRGVELTNDSDLHLMPGPIAVYDSGAYAGDAQIEHIARGAKRLLTYAVDHDLDISREQSTRGDIRRIRIVNGLLERTHASQQTTTYTINNTDTDARTVLIEQPKSPGWNITSNVKPIEETESLYRFEVSIDGDDVATFAVTTERVWSQSLSVADLAIDELLSYTRNGKASKAVVEAVSTAATMKGRILDLSERIERLNSEAAEITNEQNRIRSNMNSIDRRSDLYERYMTKLNEQETRLEDIRELRQNVQLQLDAATNELRMFLNDLNVS